MLGEPFSRTLVTIAETELRLFVANSPQVHDMNNRERIHDMEHSS